MNKVLQISSLFIFGFLFLATGQSYETIYEFITRDSTIAPTNESSITTANNRGKTIVLTESYFINGVRVSKYMNDQNQKAFNKRSARDSIPYRLISFDLDSVKISDCIMYGFCHVGYYYVFHPNGKLKIRGAYREMSLDEIRSKKLPYGDCNPIKIGKWIYYDKNGAELSVEEHNEK